MRKLVNMRLPVELLGRVDSVCGSRGRTEFTVRALEATLGGLASKEAPAEARGVSPGRLKSDSSYPASPQAFRCPIASCEKRFGSDAARCPLHGRKAVAA